MGKLHEKSVPAHYSTYFVEYNAMRGKFSAGYSVTEDYDTPSYTELYITECIW